MIHTYASDVATQMGIQLSQVAVIEDWSVFCQDAYLLNLSSCNQLVSIVVYKHDLDNLHNAPCRERLDDKLRSALSRLQLLIEP
jgi:hypothetical protein